MYCEKVCGLIGLLYIRGGGGVLLALYNYEGVGPVGETLYCVIQGRGWVKKP